MDYNLYINKARGESDRKRKSFAEFWVFKIELFKVKLSSNKMTIIRERSNIIWRFEGEGGLLKPSECRHMGEGELAKSSYNFYSGWKSLIHSFSCSVYVILGLRQWVGWKCHMDGGLAENVRILSYGGGLKLLKKPSYYIWTFPKSCEK